MRGASLVGRGEQIGILHDLVAATGTPRAVALVGDAGIGKTTLWEAGLALARDAGFRVLFGRPTDAEVGLSFVALSDLLDGVDVQGLVGVPGPQRHALEVALLRAEPEDPRPDPRATSAGLVSALRELAARERVLVAIDDVQWLDPASAAALVFAARRLGGDDVRFLLTRRSGAPSDVERALDRDGLRLVDVGPLSLGAAQQLLSERLGLILPRRVSLRLIEAAQGNPLFLLEIGRAVTARGVPAIGADLPVPTVVNDLFGERVRKLPPRMRRPLLAVALSEGLSVTQLARITDRASLEEAVSAGLLIVDREGVRASHPLLALAARQGATARTRRELHRELAGAVDDETLRARHLALGTPDADAAVAAIAAAAAAAASARGSIHDAIELAEQALRLTPDRDEEHGERLLALAESLTVGGEHDRVRELLAPRLGELEAGSQRARAHLLLATVAMDLAGDEAHVEQALAECDADPALRASALARKAGLMSSFHVARIDEAEATALEALDAARAAGGGAEQDVWYALAWARVLRGRPLDDLRRYLPQSSSEGAAAADGIGGRPLCESSIDRYEGMRLAHRGRVEEAREIFGGLLALAEHRGENGSCEIFHFHLCELAVRTGDVEAAALLLSEHEEWTDAPASAVRIRCRALLAATRGRPDEAAQLAEVALAASEPIGDVWGRLESIRARGTAALLGHDAALSVESLGLVWEHTEREGVEEPGVFPVAPDLVEALLELERNDEARAVAARLGELAEALQHPWGMIAARRCNALLQLASGYVEHAEATLAAAAAANGELGLRFDRARMLLSLGTAQRRLKKRSAARRTLQGAATAFDELACDGWAERANEELGRVSARRPVAEGELTAAERRVVDLAASGLANKEIAARLVVTVHTVEVHLSHAYAKLGVRSRGQLARRLASGP